LPPRAAVCPAVATRGLQQFDAGIAEKAEEALNTGGGQVFRDKV